MNETIDPLDVSLRDFETPPSPVSLRHSIPPSEPAVMTDDEQDEDEDEMIDRDPESGDSRHRHHHLLASETASVGGFSPPAWRRLGNGDRSSGFWRPPPVESRLHPPSRHQHSLSRESSPECEGDETDGLIKKTNGAAATAGNNSVLGVVEILDRAMRTRLPRGSMSPDKERSPSPERAETEDVTLRMDNNKVVQRKPTESPEPPAAENYIRFAVRAEVQQRTEPIEAAINFIRKRYATLTATWASTLCSLLVFLLSLSMCKNLVQPASPRPAGDLVKVAGLARSFEPLIYYSEHAVAQVHDLQATSVAVWDLGESVRSSDMKDAVSIVADLDALSETMKTLAEEMTRFFARVDGDIDAILNVMDWSKMHLDRFHNSPPPSTLSSAYDNVHNLLCQAQVLEDATGTLTPVGTVASWVFGPSNPQREQRIVQLLFREFLTVLEDSIQSELQHAITLFALFESVDRHFLNLARTVVRESSAQEELYADLLSGLWARILGPHAAQVRKFEQNRLLLQDVRQKTVYNKGVLVEHNGKLLTLKASLESLRSKLVSPLVRGVNSTTLTLEDQIRGISDVSQHLAEVRKQQKSKVMQTLYGTTPGRKFTNAIGEDGFLS